MPNFKKIVWFGCFIILKSDMGFSEGGMGGKNNKFFFFIFFFKNLKKELKEKGRRVIIKNQEKKKMNRLFKLPTEIQTVIFEFAGNEYEKDAKSKTLLFIPIYKHLKNANSGPTFKIGTPFNICKLFKKVVCFSFYVNGSKTVFLKSFLDLYRLKILNKTLLPDIADYDRAELIYSYEDDEFGVKIGLFGWEFSGDWHAVGFKNCITTENFKILLNPTYESRFFDFGEYDGPDFINMDESDEEEEEAEEEDQPQTPWEIMTAMGWGVPDSDEEEEEDEEDEEEDEDDFLINFGM